MKLNKMVFDDKKIEAAANRHIDTEYARYNSGKVEEEMICLRGKDSFKAGAKWAINKFLKDLWHDVDEIPKRAKAFIFECGDYSMNYHVGMMFNPNDYKKNAEIWHMNRWCYLEDILPKQEGGEQ